MKSARIVLITAGSIILLGGLFVLGYLFIGKFRTPAESPFKAIPGNTALIIKLNKAGNLLEEMNRSNLLWRELSRFPGISSVRNELHVVDSASRKNTRINEILQHFNILISISLSGRNTFASLYLASLPRAVSESDILDFIQDLTAGKASVTESPYASTKIHRVQLKGAGDPFYFGVLKGVFMGGFHADLVKKAIDRLSLNTPMAASSGFQRVESTTGKNVDANIYVNYRFFSLVLSKITRAENLSDLMKFSRFADWSGLDLIIKKDELLFNGFTVASDSSQHFLALFSEQKPQTIRITQVIPQSVAYLTFFGWSDPAQFVTRLETRFARDENYPRDPTEASAVIEQFQLSINDFFLPWLGNEGCLFVVPDPLTREEVPYAAFRTNDSLLTVARLLELADTIGVKADSLLFRGERIYRCPLPNFLPVLFGDLYSKAETKCFTLLNGYVVFGRSPKELENIIRSFEAGDVLMKSREFTDFSGNLSAKSGIFCYFNTRNSIASLKGMLNEELRDQLSPVMDSIRKFESVAFQYNSQDGLFYSNVFLRYDPNYGTEGPLQWQAILDTTISGRPQIVNAGPDNSPAVVVTDIAGTMYLTGADGHVLWKQHIMGTLQGEVHTIGLPGDKSTYLLFNTETHLYLIRSDGQFADNYPMRFPLHATNPIAVADFGNNKNLSVFVAFQDNRLYRFTMDGKSVQPWNRPNLMEEILLPASAVKTGGKEFILIRGSKGHGMITDQNGDERIAFDPKIRQSANSAFYPNKTGKKGLFITTDVNGKALFIQENGKTSEVTMNLFGPDHRFFYHDITGNSQPEFIYVDRSRIYYYNRNYKLVYSYAFRREVNAPPFLLHSPDGRVMIGFVSAETNELFIFDNQGYRELESGIRGNTPFDIGRFGPGDELNLVVGSGKILKNFLLPKLQ
jgi:hypothetical protein